MMIENIAPKQPTEPFKSFIFCSNSFPTINLDLLSGMVTDIAMSVSLSICGLIAHTDRDHNSSEGDWIALITRWRIFISPYNRLMDLRPIEL